MRMLQLLVAGALGTLAATTALAEEAVREAALFKTPQCGCCEGYADYLRENGFEVTVTPTEDLVAMSRQAGIADELQGCHLTMIDGYAVSGHVPVAAVERLLDERPDILGITLPGMPMGSPGMSGSQTEPFTIYSVGPDAPEVFAVE